ncbi:MAG: choice-of-anchor I family protein, partial [Novosphingobium sp.]|uniref:choice-of-anchor I family protein n=1 Tax=Novosphingobium sp. TaxID=1874826 RepID=UPI00301A6EBC
MPLTTTPSNALGLTQVSALKLPGAEISAFDAATKTLWVTSLSGVRVVDLSNPASPTVTQTITFTGTAGSSNDVNSVAIKNGIVAVAVNAATPTDNGKVFLFNTAGTLLKTVDVGAVPDNLVFTPDGTKILVANEGEPNLETAGAQLTTNPVGSISIIDISTGAANATVQTAGFDAYNSQAATLISNGVRLFTSVPAFSSAGTTVAQDLEPEYIAISPDGTKALVTLQEANSIAIVDIATATVTDIKPLGLKDFSTLKFDGSDRDNAAGNGTSINLQTGVKVFGLYQPDAIASFTTGGQTYYIIANEGDDRNDFLNPDETTTVGNAGYILDPTIFPNAATLKGTGPNGIGRLTVSNLPGLRGDIDNDGKIDQIITYGGRSFSILDANGNRVFDSGSHIDETVAAISPQNFDDTRSDNKGSEPEGVTTAVIGGKVYAFVGLERFAGTMVYDVTNPTDPSFVTFASSPSAFTAGATNGSGFGTGDTAYQRPEGGIYISAADSPTGKALYVVSNEGTGGTSQGSIVTYEVAEAGNSAPTITSNDGGDTASINVAENSAVVTTVTANDVDAGTTITYTIAGGADAAKFAINSTTGALSFVNAPNFERPTDAGGNNVYDVIVRASDSTLSDTQALAVTVTNVADTTSSQTPYLVGTQSNVTFQAIITTGDATSKVGGGTYLFGGIPDGLGMFDNGDGTVTVLTNHEIGNTLGVVRDHGAKGAYVSKLIINKTDLSVISGGDAFSTYKAYNPVTGAFETATFAFTRFCSADLAPTNAFYNAATGKGTQEKIFLTGEESGAEGKLLGVVASGAENGTAYELAGLGKFSHENAVANGFVTQDKTIVLGTDDSTPGQVYVYIGTKTDTGTAVEKAGLTNGKLFGFKVDNLNASGNAETNATAANGTFSLVDLGDVKSKTGAQLQSASDAAGVTTFLRPEDISWDPTNPARGYFVTTNNFTSPSRLYQFTFNDIANPEAGGTITAVLDGTEGQKMLDNITVNADGKVILQEDVGTQDHLGKIWQYDPVTDKLTQIAVHDPARFQPGGANFITNDEESSGVIDVTATFGDANTKAYLLDVQSHKSVGGELVEGGQLLLMKVALNAPVITSNGGNATASISVAENGTAVTTVVATDDAIDTVTYAITGGADASAFDINAATGVLTFKTAPDFETKADAGADNVYDVTITASDGLKTDTQDLAITVTNVNEAPAPTGTKATLANGTEDTSYTVTKAQLLQGFTDVDGDTLSIGSLSVNNGSASQNLDGSWTVSLPANYNGALAFTYSVVDGNGGSVAASLTATVDAVNDAPALTGTKATLANGTEDTDYTVTKAQLLQGFTDVDGDTLSIGSLSVNNGSASQNPDGSWTVSLPANYNGALAFTYSVVDGNGGSVAGSLTTTVNAVNDAPALTGTKATLANGTEDTAYTVTKAQLLQGFTDVEGDTLSIGSLSVNNGSASQNLDGSWTVSLPANYNGALAFTYSVVDGNGGSVAASLTATINAVNDVPVIDSNLGGATAAISLAENTTAVTTVHAVDADTGTTPAYSVGGADAALFAIDAVTGALTFKVAPNFEAPGDVGANNVYDVVVTASDGTATDTQTLTITVTDVLETTDPVGTAGNDKIIGTSGADSLYGLLGNDT